ncbi:MAG TPA: glutamate dehydrogenase, partial [Erythrobacter sp.]|nr:glutamate dehydrogenase [Erythrobacter sp.]
MGSNTAALPKKLQNAITERMRLSLLSGDTPFEKARLEDAAAFVGELASQRTRGRSAMAIESVSDDRRLTRIAIINEDMPFLVDSVAATIAALGLSIDRLVHPVIPVERDGKGRLQAIPDRDKDDADRESMIYIETARVDAKTRRQLQETLKLTLGDVRAAVSDWPQLRDAMAADAERIAGDSEEGAELLEWLNSGMLTQLGHVTRYRDGRQEDELGICRKSAAQLLAEASYDRAFAWFAAGNDPRRPLIIKANHLSNVHRRVPLDLFIVPVEDNGETVALSLHAGVWTSAALAAPPRNV